jgi:hypothetical protein
MTVAELNAKYPLEGSMFSCTWHVDDDGRPCLWVDTDRSGYEVAWIDQHGRYNGPSGRVLATDIAKLAQASADHMLKLRLEQAEQDLAELRAKAGEP